MLNTIIGSSNMIGKICASTSASLESVLFREDLVSYLQTHRDDTKEALPVLEFVERHFDKLLKMALQPVQIIKMMLSMNAKKVIASKPILNDEKLVLFVENAAELICYYMSISRVPVYYVEHIVPSVIITLSQKHLLTSTVAQSSRRLLLGAFDVSPVMTTKAIASTLDESIVCGLVANISVNYILADTIIAIFGSALRSSDMVSPITDMRTFTEGWIRCGFVQSLALHMTVALTSTKYHPYFYFVKELLKRGFSHSAGPVIDVFMEYNIITQVMTSVLEACEGAVSNPEGYPLLSFGVEVLHAIVMMTRQSFIAPDTKEMYAGGVTFISPLRFLQVHAQRFSDLLVLKTSPKVSVSRQNRADPVLVTLCEMFVELLRFNLRDTDYIIVNARFLEKLLDLCRSYPDCYRLTFFLQQALLTVFFRPLLINDPNSEVNVILRYIINQETEKSEVQGFLSTCVNICADVSLQYTSLGAFLIDVCHRLAYTSLFKNSACLLQNVVEPLLSNSFVMERIQNMERLITGENFTAVGSGGAVHVRHRPLVNYAKGSLQNNDLSIRSPPSGESDAAADQWAEGDARDRSCAPEDAERGDGKGERDGDGKRGEGENSSRGDGEEELPGEANSGDNVDAATGESVDVELSAADALHPTVEDTVTVEPVWILDTMEVDVSPHDHDYPLFDNLQLSLEEHKEEAEKEDEQQDLVNEQSSCARNALFELRGASVDSADGDAWIHETIAAMEDVLGVVKES